MNDNNHEKPIEEEKEAEIPMNKCLNEEVWKQERKDEISDKKI